MLKSQFCHYNLDIWACLEMQDKIVLDILEFLYFVCCEEADWWVHHKYL